MVHLTLDEMYSVDFLDVYVKRSFGTALKPVSLHSLKATTLLLLATIVIFYTAPGAATFVNILGDLRVYRNMKGKLFPKGRWFKDASGVQWGQSVAPNPLSLQKVVTARDLPGL
jgi:hypothetical protein